MPTNGFWLIPVRKLYHGYPTTRSKNPTTISSSHARTSILGSMRIQVAVKLDHSGIPSAAFCMHCDIAPDGEVPEVVNERLLHDSTISLFWHILFEKPLSSPSEPLPRPILSLPTLGFVKPPARASTITRSLASRSTAQSPLTL